MNKAKLWILLTLSGIYSLNAQTGKGKEPLLEEINYEPNSTETHTQLLHEATDDTLSIADTVIVLLEKSQNIVGIGPLYLKNIYSLFKELENSITLTPKNRIFCILTILKTCMITVSRNNYTVDLRTTLKILFGLGADAKKVNSEGYAPLNLYLRAGRYEPAIVETLIANGAAMDYAPQGIETPRSFIRRVYPHRLPTLEDMENQHQDGATSNTEITTRANSSSSTSSNNQPIYSEIKLISIIGNLMQSSN